MARLARVRLCQDLPTSQTLVFGNVLLAGQIRQAAITRGSLGSIHKTSIFYLRLQTLEFVECRQLDYM